jgi:hypothetical protein
MTEYESYEVNDQIELLRMELDKYRQALEDIVSLPRITDYDGGNEYLDECSWEYNQGLGAAQDIAEKALNHDIRRMAQA